MNNHYHLLLSPVFDNGISRFMQKFNMGYAKYFNERYARNGVLWQGKHKKVLVNRLAHELYVPYYVHLNPLDFILPEWREGKVRNTAKALDYLRKYRWSSHRDYLGIKNFPSILEMDFLTDALGFRKRYERELSDIVSSQALAGPSSSIET
jgi:putative transposase